MDTKHRAGGATISAGWLAIFGRELLTLDPERTIDVLGNIVSPTSFYLGMVVIGVGGLSYFGWPVVQWFWTIQRRRKAKQYKEQQIKREKEARKQKEKKDAEQKTRKGVVQALQRLQTISKDIVESQTFESFSSVDENTERKSEAKVLIDMLKRVSLIPSNSKAENYRVLHDQVSTLLPIVQYHGIEAGKNKLNELRAKEDGYEEE